VNYTFNFKTNSTNNNPGQEGNVMKIVELFEQ